MFCERLKELRIAKKYTLKTLGELIGMAESTISLYESGKREPDITTILALSYTLQTTTDYLLGSQSSQISVSNNITEISDKNENGLNDTDLVIKYRLIATYRKETRENIDALIHFGIENIKNSNAEISIDLA